MSYGKLLRLATPEYPYLLKKTSNIHFFRMFIALTGLIDVDIFKEKRES